MKRLTKCWKPGGGTVVKGTCGSARLHRDAACNLKPGTSLGAALSLTHKYAHAHTHTHTHIVRQSGTQSSGIQHRSKAHDRTKRSPNRTYPDWMSFRMHFPVHRYLKAYIIHVHVCMCVVCVWENLSRIASADGCTSLALDCSFVTEGLHASCSLNFGRDQGIG